MPSRSVTRILAVALGLMVSVATSVAKADDQGKTAMGAGVHSCGTWTGERAARDVGEVVDEAWVVGYLSGVATWSDLDPLKGIDGNAVWAWIDNYCRAHPLVRINGAVDAFIKEHPR
jgi:hypothetical protein